MYKLMIVDNEHIIRQGIRYGVNWTEHGVEVVCEAADGREAAQLAAAYRPDIVITDIRMPVMDGLELAAQVRNMLPGAYIIMLSGYSDTAYLQSAISVGVNAYLMKTADCDPIVREVEKARELLGQRAAAQSRSAVLRSILDNYSPSIHASLMGELLTMEKSEEYVRTVAGGIGVALEGPLYALLLCEAPAGKAYAILSELSARLADKHPFAAYLQERYIAIIVSCDNTGWLKSADAMIRQVGDTFGERLVCVCCGPVTELRTLAGQYARARQLAGAAFWLTGRGLVPAAEVSAAGRREPFYEQEHKLLQQITRELQADQAAVQAYWVAAAQALLPREELGFSLRKLFAVAGWPEEERTALLDEGPTVLRQRLLALCASHRPDTGLVERAREYIEANYHRQLTLTELSGRLYVSPTYLSRLFKQETGHGVKRYINLRRIREAQRLLRESDLKIGEIALRTGFNDYKHFSDNFLKYTGVSAGDYRRIK